MLPSKLDVRFDATVEKITYADDDANGSAVIECSNGHVLEVDKVVLTSPLGVLKAGSIAFDPPLPTWKKGAIERMGFGLLNKVRCTDGSRLYGPLADSDQGCPPL